MNKELIKEIEKRLPCLRIEIKEGKIRFLDFPDWNKVSEIIRQDLIKRGLTKPTGNS